MPSGRTDGEGDGLGAHALLHQPVIKLRVCGMGPSSVTTQSTKACVSPSPRRTNTHSFSMYIIYTHTLTRYVLTARSAASARGQRRISTMPSTDESTLHVLCIYHTQYTECPYRTTCRFCAGLTRQATTERQMVERRRNMASYSGSFDFLGVCVCVFF